MLALTGVKSQGRQSSSISYNSKHGVKKNKKTQKFLFSNNINRLKDFNSDKANLTSSASDILKNSVKNKNTFNLKNIVKRENAIRKNKRLQAKSISSQEETIGTPSASNYKTLFEEPLRSGMTGEKVKRFQKALNKVVPVEATGTYDQNTVKAVKKFQRKAGIGVDGVAGGATFGNLWNEVFWEQGEAVDLNPPSFYEKLPKNIKLEANIEKQRVYLLDGNTGKAIKEYPISSGKNNGTPRGNFNITQINEKPYWYPTASMKKKGAKTTSPGPYNPLGPVKMRLNETPFLFHGVPTNKFSSLGKYPASHGCMRMFPQDAWELHNIVKSGTAVKVV